MMTERYLPLIGSDGTWIERMDLFLLARMSFEDKVSEKVVHQLYQTMLQADNTIPVLNPFEQGIADRDLKRSLRHRRYAGRVVESLARIADTTNQSPSLSQGLRLAAFKQWKRDGGRAQLESLEREVRKGFSNYRSTVHLQAAMVVGQPGLDDIEMSEVDTLRFLANARWFEQFIDETVVRGDFSWEPWRVPPRVEVNVEFNAEPLTDEERAAMN